MNDYFDSRLDLLLGQACVLLPPRHASATDPALTVTMALPRLAASDVPPAFGDRRADVPTPANDHSDA